MRRVVADIIIAVAAPVTIAPIWTNQSAATHHYKLDRILSAIVTVAAAAISSLAFML